MMIVNKISLLFFLIPTIIFSIDINYDNTKEAIKEKIDLFEIRYKNHKISGVLNSNYLYIPPKTLGENLLQELDTLKIELFGITSIKYGSNNQVENMLGFGVKFLEKGNELNSDIGVKFSYDTNKSSKLILIDMNLNYILRKTNTMFSILNSYNYDGVINSHFLNNTFKISNQFFIKNRFIFEIFANYILSSNFKNKYVDERKIIWTKKSNFSEHIFGLGLKTGYKYDKAVQIYSYVGLDFNYFLNKERQYIFDNVYEINTKLENEKFIFSPNIGIITKIKNNHLVSLQASYVFSPQNKKRYGIKLSYIYESAIK